MSESVTRNRSSGVPQRRETLLLRILGAVAVLTVFTLYDQGLGLIIGTVVAIGAVFLPGVYAFAVGHLGLLVVFPSPTLGQVVLSEIALVPVLTASMLAHNGGIRAIAATSLCYIGLAAVVATGVETMDALWITAVCLAVLVAVLAYGIHRYEQLQLGLVEETT